MVDNDYGLKANVRPEVPTVRAPSPKMEWASDAVAEMLRALEVPFIALNPGASYRGLHDSLVNHLGNERPEIVVCLHEEHAVAVAHGYAKVTGRPMAAGLHANVVLMHATMALFNAFCDRVPLIALGATGPVDAAVRRPWIDWIHTAADQGALVRPFVKWDDQPASAAAAVEALARADQLTRTYPSAPVYVCLDAALQESELAPGLALPDLARHRAPAPPEPARADVEAAAAILAAAERPVLLAGRTGRGEAEWEARVRLAERLGARVLTDLKAAAAFPTRHPLHAAAPGTFLTPSGGELIRSADAILALDWIDVGGTLATAYDGAAPPARVISCTGDHALHNGWSKDHFALPAVDVNIAGHPDRLVAALLEHGVASASGGAPGDAAPGAPPPRRERSADELSLHDLATALRAALAGRDTCLVRLPLTWDGAELDIAHPLDYLGQDGGAGLASGPGMAVGAALALRGTDRLAVAVLGDGDFLMGATALWTAARYRLPLLVVVANNRSYFNDEIHQERVARRRGRPVENRWVGQQIRDPDPDLATLACSLGLRGHGPVTTEDMLEAALSTAVQEAATGAAVLVDVRVGGSVPAS
jgi:thiamine pyrophosphate-dependent acetolactate synthase large subunit-like protein